jgi:flagellar motor protein MotB
METKKPLFGDDSLRKLNRIIFDYYFSLSTLAASKGNYTQASDYLSELLKSEEESVIVFDLQAKIAAQQGKFREAEFLWKKCLKAEPDNPDYIAALNRINKILSSKSFRFYYLFKLLKVFTIVLLIIVLLFFYFYERVDRKQQLDFIVGQNEAMISKVENFINLKSPENELLLSISDKIKTINGITVDGDNNEIAIYFNEGLFSRADNIKSNQLITLDNISQTLSPYAGQVVVKIIGSTDSTPISFDNTFKSNADLSISRAKTVFDRIYEFSRIPREDLTIGSLSESNNRFTNDTPENRMKNRTVIIKISQKN